MLRVRLNHAIKQTPVALKINSILITILAAYCKPRSINKIDVINVIEPVIMKIIAMLSNSLKNLPDEIYCEILETGITLTGGGACIEGMDNLIASKTNMKVKIVIDLLHAVINGASQSLNYWIGKKDEEENFT